VNACRRWLGATAVFGVLVTLNAGGYRYGAADQAFYIPAVVRHLSPHAFPADRVLIDPQAAYTVWDEGAAWLVRATGLELPLLFLAGYLATVGVFALAVLRLGERLYGTSLASWALLAALTLKHRIAQTGVNTFEGYFHPRVLAFALGLVAVGSAWSGRWVAAAALVAAAAVAHPTTALWFALWLAVAAVTNAPRRRVLAGVAVAAAGLTALALWRLGRASVTGVMDPEWTATFAGKDYLFPTEWRASTWATNLLSPALVASLAFVRARQGAVTRNERGIVAGALGLFVVFLASLPFVHARHALAVQLQVSRVFWALELLATAYLVWWLAEARWGRRAGPIARRAVVVVTALSAAALARGVFVTLVEHAGRPPVQVQLPEGEWRDVTKWAAAHTSADAAFLVDPGHAWKYGLGFRVGASRDVYLEEDKDAALAFYSRPVALRVRERIEALPDFPALTPARARALGERFGLSYVIVERPIDLPEVYRNGRFFVYRIDSTGSPPE
jgi:hypothetical protein